MYQARVLKVMIASPSDVATEREVARDVIHEWNDVHAEDRKVVLMPIRWESHARPDLGGRPQELINKRVLKGCDVLIGIFWTRIGTPTGTAASGTVEEINEHVAAGKTAMIYFSAAPVVPDSVDADQYARLKEFRTECSRDRGLIETFDSVSDFRDKLARQLAQLVIDKFSAVPAAANDSHEALDFARSQQRRSANPLVPVLSNEARELLLAGASAQDGRILNLRTMGGTSISAGKRQFVEPGNPRSEATWEGALQALVRAGLIEDVGHKREIYRVTAKGYEIADLLRTAAPRS